MEELAQGPMGLILGVCVGVIILAVFDITCYTFQRIRKDLESKR